LGAAARAQQVQPLAVDSSTAAFSADAVNLAVALDAGGLEDSPRDLGFPLPITITVTNPLKVEARWKPSLYGISAVLKEKIDSLLPAQNITLAPRALLPQSFISIARTRLSQLNWTWRVISILSSRAAIR